jgi:hypothetical protein
MVLAMRFPVVAVFLALATACTPVQQADSSVQLPGDSGTRAGLEVPPDVWARPALQTAGVSPDRK